MYCQLIYQLSIPFPVHLQHGFRLGCQFKVMCVTGQSGFLFAVLIQKVSQWCACRFSSSRFPVGSSANKILGDDIKHEPHHAVVHHRWVGWDNDKFGRPALPKISLAFFPTFFSPPTQVPEPSHSRKRWVFCSNWKFWNTKPTYWLRR